MRVLNEIEGAGMFGVRMAAVSVGWRAVGNSRRIVLMFGVGASEWGLGAMLIGIFSIVGGGFFGAGFFFLYVGLGSVDVSRLFVLFLVRLLLMDDLEFG